MASLLCRIGMHHWESKQNLEVDGPGGDYQLCSRCGKEKAGYGKPPASGVARS